MLLRVAIKKEETDIEECLKEDVISRITKEKLSDGSQV